MHQSSADQQDVLGWYTRKEEVANSLSHAIAVPPAILGLVLLLMAAVDSGDLMQIISSAIFGSALILTFLISATYHGLKSKKPKIVFRVLDHLSIYLLIAGSYTPFTLVSLRGPWGWSIFGVVWGLALFGIVTQLWRLRTGGGSGAVWLYVLMGWTMVVGMKPLIDAVPKGGITLLVLGGLLYTGGIVFYRWRSLKYHHAYWHLFVLAGSICHFFAVYLYVTPAI